MQTESMFTEAGWDFTTPIWIMCNEGEYPKLWWQGCNTAPVADGGDDITAYACIDGTAQVQLDGSGSYDDDGDELEYFWFIGNDQIATGVDPNILLPVGEHTIELIVNDGMEDSEPNDVVITVIGMLDVNVHILPRVINRNNHAKRVIAIIRLPEGIHKADVSDEPFVLHVAGDEVDGIEATWQRVIGRPGRVSVFAFFDKAELMNAVEGVGRVEVTVTGKLKSGRGIYGSDTIRINQPRRRRPVRWRRR